jgi:hypothetical protein
MVAAAAPSSGPPDEMMDPETAAELAEALRMSLLENQ